LFLMGRSNALSLTEKLRKQDGGAHRFAPSMPLLLSIQSSRCSVCAFAVVNPLGFTTKRRKRNAGDVFFKIQSSFGAFFRPMDLNFRGNVWA